MNKNLATYHQKNRYYEIFSELEGKKKHVEAVIRITRAIAEIQHSTINMELLLVLAEHHDDGRVNQFKLLGKLWDTEVSHNVLGIDRIDRFINENDLEVDGEIQMLREVMLYHGRKNLIYNIPEETMEYIDIITAADDFENATSCVSYLISEVDNDEKGYCKKNPELNQKEITSDLVWESFTKGQHFDKIKHCHTYADYVLFAAMLATKCIKQYGSIAKVALMQPGYGFSSILEGFKVTFEKTLTPELADKAYKVMQEMLN